MAEVRRILKEEYAGKPLTRRATSGFFYLKKN